MKKINYKMKLKSFSLFMCAAILLTLIVPNTYVSAAVLEMTADTVYAIRSEASKNLYLEMMNDFVPEGEYPDDVAAVCMQEDGSIVVSVTSEEAIQKYNAAMPLDAADQIIASSRALAAENGHVFGRNSAIDKTKLISYTVLPYSYNEIRHTQSALDNVMGEFKISETQLIDPENALYVFLKDEAQQQAILNYLEEQDCETDFIVFKKAVGTLELTALGYSGEKISTSGDSDGSIGFPARYGDRVGYVTAAHVTGGSSWSIRITRLGEEAYGRVQFYQCSGSLDASFVEFNNSNSSVTNVIRPNGTTYRTIMGTSNLVIYGSSVEAYGSTSGKTTGTVSSTSVSHPIGEEDTVITDLFSFNAQYIGDTVQHGDSGGPIVNSSGYLLGIIHGKIELSRVSYGCKYSNIASKGVYYNG